VRDNAQTGNQTQDRRIRSPITIVKS